MIRISNVSKKYGRLEALKQVNAELNKGECIALIGPNGCGKTTLIKSILGMVIPESGEIFVDGDSINKSFTYRSKIGYMPQIGKYPSNMTVGQVIQLIRNIRKNENVVDLELYDKYKLDDILTKRMAALSGGTTQKVSATLSFLFDPAVLILDEPTAGLDPLAAEILKEKIISEKKKGKLILISSHLLSELDDLVTQILFMQEGKILFHKSSDQLKAETDSGSISKAITQILKRTN